MGRTRLARAAVGRLPDEAAGWVGWCCALADVVDHTAAWGRMSPVVTAVRSRRRPVRGCRTSRSSAATASIQFLIRLLAGDLMSVPAPSEYAFVIANCCIGHRCGCTIKR